MGTPVSTTRRSSGKEPYRSITHGTSFYREWFKKFKGSVDRIFMTGVSPVTMDDLTSGFNIAANVSQDEDLPQGYRTFVCFTGGIGRMTAASSS